MSSGRAWAKMQRVTTVFRVLVRTASGGRLRRGTGGDGALRMTGSSPSPGGIVGAEGEQAGGGCGSRGGGVQGVAEGAEDGHLVAVFQRVVGGRGRLAGAARGTTRAA